MATVGGRVPDILIPISIHTYIYMYTQCFVDVFVSMEIGHTHKVNNHTPSDTPCARHNVSCDCVAKLQYFVAAYVSMEIGHMHTHHVQDRMCLATKWLGFNI